MVLVMIAIGFIFFQTNRDRFDWYVAEDNLVEWITVVGLLMSSAICFYRFFTLFRVKRWWFLLVTFLLGLFLFFAAGEEISWGQRIFGIESSEYFQKNNAQGETNLHNLVVNGVKINKLVFTLVLGVMMGIYLILFPLLHAKNAALRDFMDRSGIPVARLYQIIAFGLAAGLTTLIPHGKNAELLECGASLLFFLIIRFPVNNYVFGKHRSML